MAFERLTVSLHHFHPRLSLYKSLNSVQVVNDSKDTNGSVNDNSAKAQHAGNDHDEPDDDKKDEGGAGDPAAAGSMLALSFRSPIDAKAL